MSKVTIDAASLRQKQVVANLMQLYIHELSNPGEDVLRPDGLFDVGPYFDAYWYEPERHPFLIWAEAELAGFALVREIEHCVFSVAEFFVVRRFRGTGLAERAAIALFDQFRGEWQVAQIESNVRARRFWRRTIRKYTGGVFEDRRSESQPRGPMQVFRNRVDL